MLSHLIRQSRHLLVAAAFASIVSGVCGVLLVTQINAALTAPDGAARTALAWRFAAIAVAAMLSHMASSVLFERLSQHAHAELRRFISARVLGSDYRRLEEIGAPKVQSALSEHSANVAGFFVSFPAILVNAIVVAGCLVYMALLSWQVFLASAVVIGLGSVGYHVAHLRAIRHLDAASMEQDHLFGHFRSLVDGAKELRLNAAKRTAFAHDVLGASIETVRRRRAFGMSVFVVSAAWGNFLIYAFIGLVLFVLVGEVPDRARIMTGFALVFVYMVAPLEILLMSLPRANLARVSAARIDEIAQQLACSEAAVTKPPVRGFDHIVLKGVCHRYWHEGVDDIFTLGPVDLTFRPGQVTYLVGGNGSGKTSLAKLLVGLYRPEEGQVLLDGEVVDDSGRDRYRQTFSAIFSDFHLFDRLLDLDSADLDERGNALLARLHLQHKVQVRDGAFTTRSLSLGQRKRLALVVAYLEDRPFLVFDEWAADQDPVFKDVFYRELLPDLKARGKAVLAITHDDRYFPLADRLIRMENGQVVVVESPRRGTGVVRRGGLTPAGGCPRPRGPRAEAVESAAVTTPSAAAPWTARVVESLEGVDRDAWQRLAGGNPFVGFDFLSLLERSGCVSRRTGWLPQHLLLESDGRLVGAAPAYLKSHSRGEFVFDQGWAQAFERHGLPYYPKLVLAAPFSPVTGPRLLAADAASRAGLAQAVVALAREREVSSVHALFVDDGARSALVDEGFLVRESVQFHWTDAGYGSFDGFLASLSHDKRKKIKQDRKQVEKAGVTFRWLTGADLGTAHLEFFYDCYVNTYQAHWSSPYLTLPFFLEWHQRCPKALVLVLAEQEGRPIACALNVLGDGVLYGRYWGSTTFVSGLHFETCYLQAIAFCLANGVGTFEGAQGEHKMARGLMPVRTQSAHWIADPRFAAAIEDFLGRETEAIDGYVAQLEASSPFREGPPPGEGPAPG